MLPLDVKHRWMLLTILFFGIVVKNSICDGSDTDDICRQKKYLFVSAKDMDGHFPTKSVYDEVSGSKLCFGVHRGNVLADCCNETDFNCNFEIRGHENDYSLIMNKEALSKQDIVLMRWPHNMFNCMPSEVCNTSTGFLFNIEKCLNTGKENIRLTQNSFCEIKTSYDEDACKGLAETDYMFTVLNEESHCVSCKPPGKKPDVNITVPPPGGNNGTGISPENAGMIMKNLHNLLEKMGNSSSAAVTIGHIKGVITKLLHKNPTSINIGITANADMNILENNNDSATGFYQSVQIPTEASAMAVKRNGTFAGVLRFPGMHQDDPNSFFLNDELLGIEMGAEISNLSHTIDIHYRNVDKNGSIVSCRSWNGTGKSMIWIRDGCQTKETNNSITCQCSHLTFFAILMSPPPVNISTSDVKFLTYITSIGCGLSILFLSVALFMHCLLRKGKASQATDILMNLFVAMLTLNLSFLLNESIAELGDFGACVVVAAFMHYTMLATCTWFFVEALHLYFSLWKFPSKKHYMAKMCVTGWVPPAVVVIALLALRKYDLMVIYTDDGNSAKMCWISDAFVHQGVNVGYYAVVFIFTFVIFIMTVRQIVLLSPTRESPNNGSTKTNSFSILALFLLLGITWAFAFFSHGPLLIASYYIFTILNSFQGFFLFIYYLNSGKNTSPSESSSGTATSDTVTPQY